MGEICYKRKLVEPTFLLENMEKNTKN